MDRDKKARELKRTAVLTSRLPLTRRKQQKSLSSVQHLNSSSSSSSGGKGTNCRRQHHLSEQLMAVDKWAGEPKHKGGSLSNADRDIGGGGGGAGPDGNEELRPPMASVAASATCSRKRVKLIRKVSDKYRVANSAVVPRKLRSAINKRAGESSSPCALGEKRKHSDVPSKIEMASGRTLKANDLLTIEEEEVSEILAALAAMVKDNQCTKSANDDRVASDDRDAKQTCLPTLPEASEGLATVLPVPSTGIFSHLEELPEEPLEAKSISDIEAKTQQKMPTALPKRNEVDLELNDITKANQEAPPLLMMDGCNYHKLSDASKSACLADLSSGSSSLNGAKQSAQVDNFISMKPEVGPHPVQCTTSSTMNHDVNYLDDQNEKSLLFSLPNETKLDMQNANLTTSNHKHLTWSLSTKVVDLAFVASTRPCLSIDRQTEKPLLLSADRSWKKCATHAYISHLIQTYQNANNTKDASSYDQLKWKETTTLASNESINLRNGCSSSSAAAVPCSPVMKNQLDMTAEVFKDRTLQGVQQTHTTSGFLSQRKQTYDFLSLSAGCESNSPGNRMELCGKLPITYLHTLPPWHSTAPLSVPHRHYSSYPDYLSAAAPQQVHLQLPQYISHPLYTSHNGNLMKHQFQQQQQIWQAHLSQHRASAPHIGKWPGSKHHDASSSSKPCAQLQPVIGGSPPIELRGLAGHHSHISLQHQRMPIPLPASNQSK